jgi:Flp pilus assembly pilin Flp
MGERASLSKDIGQGLIEYALILLLIAITVIVALSIMGVSLGEVFTSVQSALAGGGADPNDPVVIAGDFIARINNFYDVNGRYPRSWGTYAFTDIGLDPEDWTGPVAGIYWGPNGGRIGLANRPGDDIEIYVKDLNGNRRHLYNGWNIWCVAATNVCYYHTVTPGNEVDLRTIEIVRQ